MVLTQPVHCTAAGIYPASVLVKRKVQGRVKPALIRLFTINQSVAWQGVDDEEPERAEKGQEEKWRQHSSYLKLHPLKGVFADCAGAGAEEKGSQTLSWN